MNRVKCSGWIGLAVCVSLLGAGCTREPDIVHQSIPRPPEPAPIPKERLLAAMIPSGDLVWVFKMSGPEKLLGEFEPGFMAIVQSLKFADPGLPTWNLPAGWIEEAPKEKNQFGRLMTLRPQDDAKNVAVAVSNLPKAGGDVMANVNRWRGQLKLPNVKTKEELAEFTKAIHVDGRDGIVVDLVGHAAKGGGKMGAPMAGAMADQNLPPDHPPIGKGRPVAPAAGPEPKITYDLPAGWVKVPPKNSVVHDQMKVTEGDESAEVTIVILGSSGNPVRDVFSNVNRWRGQLELAEISDPKKLVEEIVELKDTKSPLVLLADIANPKKAAPNRILGVLVPGRDAIWFLKMHGPDAIVGRQKANFEAFAKSFKVDG